MRQRLGLAGSLLRSPRLVILDEPGNGLDPAGARDLWGLLRRLAESGTAVLLSSHDMGASEDVCDSITVLRGGRTVFDGTLPAMRAQAPDAAYRLQTSDDREAIDHAGRVAGVSVEPAADSFLVHAERGDLDAYVIRLGRDGVAVRSMVLEVSPLESLFFRLTEGPVMEDRARRPGRLPGRDGPLIGSPP